MEGATIEELAERMSLNLYELSVVQIADAHTRIKFCEVAKLLCTKYPPSRIIYFNLTIISKYVFVNPFIHFEEIKDDMPQIVRKYLVENSRNFSKFEAMSMSERLSYAGAYTLDVHCNAQEYSELEQILLDIINDMELYEEFVDLMRQVVQSVTHLDAETCKEIQYKMSYMTYKLNLEHDCKVDMVICKLPIPTRLFINNVGYTFLDLTYIYFDLYDYLSSLKCSDKYVKINTAITSCTYMIDKSEDFIHLINKDDTMRMFMEFVCSKVFSKNKKLMFKYCHKLLSEKKLEVRLQSCEIVSRLLDADAFKSISNNDKAVLVKMMKAIEKDG